MYSIISIPDNAAFLTEQMGTKKKVWVRKDGQNYLFKEPRPATGEDWAEKVASELCALLNLPHAPYDLAVWQGKRGVISPNFASPPLRLVHGNELLAKVDKNYPMQRFFRVQEHILRSVLGIISKLIKPEPEPPLGWTPIEGIKSAVEVFVGYLMFDAWIANQDRHHENWSVLVVPKTAPEPGFSVHLSPSYDHASSLGRNETDDAREERLTTRDKGRHIKAYVERAASAFYAPPPNSEKPLSTLVAFCEAGKLHREAAQIWLDRLKSIPPQATRAILDQIPKNLITQITIEFAQTMLDLNRERLLATRPLFQ